MDINSQSAFSWEQARQTAEQVILKHSGKHLKDIEIQVLQGAYQDLTYEKMAELNFLSVNYLRGDVGHKLWHKLSVALGEEVTKTNFKAALERVSARRQPRDVVAAPLLAPPFPEGSVSLDSPFYLERDGVESVCYKALAKPGSLIRIETPKLMGKTSLLARILERGKFLGHRTVYLDLTGVELKIRKNSDKFLRWFSLMAGRQVNAENRLPDYWNTEILGSNDNCTFYFEKCLLPACNCPLLLVLDHLEQLFPYKTVVEDFFGMLKTWHNKGKMSPCWQQLHLVLAYSTECYVPLNINQSPLDGGMPLNLPEFTPQQVLFLALSHGLNWYEPQVGQLMKMVGGHPYLVQLALYEMATGKCSLEQLLREAATDAGIYRHHLRRHLQTLCSQEKLRQCWRKVVESPNPVELDPLQIYKLHSLGLIEQQGNHVMPRCQLYQDYFRRVLAA